MATKENKSLYSKFPLLTMLGAVFSFVIIPFLLLDAGLDSMLNIRAEQEISKTFEKMKENLDFLVSRSDDRKYFHSILKKAFEDALNSSDPVESIGRSIGLLKKKFPDSFKFIVWQEKGKLVDRLTDEKRYKYIVRNLYILFREVARDCQLNYPGFPENISIVTEKLNLFRGYLGRFLVPNHLRLPYQYGIQGQCILADSQDRLPLFWFQYSPALTVYCAISSAPLNRNYGLKDAIRILNRNGKIVSGIINETEIIPRFEEKVVNELLLEMGKFENAGLPQRITADRLISFKLLTPKLRGFCMIEKRRLATGYPNEEKRFIIAKLLIVLMILTFIFYCYSLRIKKITFSIRFKLAFLFLYANGLPLMILGTIGYEYLQQQRYNLIQEIHNKNERILLDIDAGYRKHLHILEIKTEEYLKDFRKAVTNQIPDPRMQNLLAPLFEKLGADEVHIFNQDGQALLSHKRMKKPASQTFMRLFATGALIFANQKENERFQALLDNAENKITVAGSRFFDRGASVLQTLLKKLNKLENLTFGTQTKLCYTTLLGNKEKRFFHSMMIIAWQEDEAQANYVFDLIRKFNHGRIKPLLGANFMFNGKVVCPGLKDQRKLLPVLQKAANLQSAQEEDFNISGTGYIATAICGKNLRNISMVAITPRSEVEEKIERLKVQIFIFILISLAISSGVAFSLSEQFLEPIRQLSEAVSQIGKRNFRFRTAIDSNDEFGDLGKIFNSSMHELEELEIARVVQEDLFPGNFLYGKRLGIYAKTVTMTRLGGDYYDFFRLDDHLSGIFMGDVAGHGIPAALIMAMAKATVLLSEDLYNPAQLLTSLHNMLYSLKSRKFKKMMTCQYMTFNDNNGVLTIANAGHCYPVIVSDRGTKSEFVEIVGSPVGISKRARYVNSEIRLEAGDTVILYSDGMLEASNYKNEIFGNERFLDLAKSAWNKNLETYYQRLFDANRSWSEKTEDDLTIVLIRFSGTGETT
ncbi:MAG: hypothetical protein Kow0029_19740 [Candidatus Rifleibacteriota bacterium]